MGWALASFPTKSGLGSSKVSIATREREGKHRDVWAGLGCCLWQAIGWEEQEGREEGFLLRIKTTPFCGVFFLIFNF
jgi:hypothetical protein